MTHEEAQESIGALQTAILLEERKPTTLQRKDKLKFWKKELKKAQATLAAEEESKTEEEPEDH